MGSSATIKQLETDFWQSMKDKDADKAMSLIADECLIAGTMGAMKIDPATYKKMTEEGKWSLESFEFSDVEVIFPNQDTAVIVYKVRQKGSMKDAAMDMTCADSSTWVRDGKDWKCALHTETILQKA